MINDPAKRPPATASATAATANARAVVVPTPTDLELRVAARKRELAASLVGDKDEPSQTVRDAHQRTRTRLMELNHLVRDGVLHGWANLTEATRGKFERWLKR